MTGQPINIFLWVLQAILAIKCLSAAFTHAFQQDKATLRYGVEKMGRPARPLLAVIAVVLLLLSVGLLLPAVVPAAGGLVVISAAVLAVTLLAGGLFHLRCREDPKLFVSLILLLMAAFAAYGRWALAPL